jgi:hypothetical protein
LPSSQRCCSARSGRSSTRPHREFPPRTHRRPHAVLPCGNPRPSSYLYNSADGTRKGDVLTHLSNVAIYERCMAELLQHHALPLLRCVRSKPNSLPSWGHNKSHLAVMDAPLPASHPQGTGGKIGGAASAAEAARGRGVRGTRESLLTATGIGGASLCASRSHVPTVTPSAVLSDILDRSPTAIAALQRQQRGRLHPRHLMCCVH